ncbi:MAG: DUF4012 domain-containing protein [Nanoarchaeota archaeon]|nr:DUF4012 domain-containing protein [Nanoarchaeota archaeon]
MKEVPKKNIESVLVDIKTPGTNYRRLSGIGTVYLGSSVAPLKKNPKPAFRIWVGTGVFAALLLGGVFVLGTNRLKSIAAQKGESIAANMMASIQSIKELNPEEARATLEKNKDELEKIEGLVGGGKKRLLLGGLGEIFPGIRLGLGLFGRISEFNLTFLKLTEIISKLQTKGLDYFMNDGASFVALLNESRDVIRNLTATAADIQNKSSGLGSISESFEEFNGKFRETYVKYTADLHGWDGALESIIALLDSKVDRHILLIFHNPSEIRPAGGFIGSYGDIVVRDGKMQSMEVGDIYWPDHPKNFERKVIPPLPLQRITDDWGARDGNWFFDFPASAKNVIGFLESSKVYKGASTTFDGAIAINTNVLGSILEFMGPIPVPEYNLTITKDSFLAELQREVETGRDKEPGKNPKRILSVITPTILERLGGLGESEKKALAWRVSRHIKEKDIMVYAKDEKLAGFLKSKGVDGGVYDLPNGFWGAYVAVVNANIGGEKTDAFMEERIAGKIDVSNDGSSFVTLGVLRTHRGKEEKDPWYRAENKNFIQIFVNPDSSVVEVEGNTKRTKYEGRYDKKVYEEIPALKAIEDTAIYLTDKSIWTMNAFGKKVLGTWFNVPGGEARTLGVRYQISGESNKDLEKKKPYALIFERQSGVKSAVSIDVRAPFGFVWQESGGPVYRFERENPEAREIVELRLVKKQ